MYPDPVDEVRARRRALLRGKYHGSVTRMLNAARKWQTAHPDQTVDLKAETRVARAS